MAEKKKKKKSPGPRVVFYNVYSPRSELVSFVTKAEGAGDVEYTRLYTRKSDDTWGIFHADHDLLSLVQLVKEDSKSWLAIGKRGEVIEISKGIAKEGKITSAGVGRGKHGFLNEIMLIGKSAYVCGARRQVYQLINKKWELISRDIVTDKNQELTGFEAMDGVSESSIYAVGWNGDIFYYNGAKWTQLDSPTDVSLSDVCCVDEDNVWICGENGVVLHRDKKKWHTIKDTKNLTKNWWAIAEYKGDIYVAGDDVLGKVVNGAIEEVTFGKKKRSTFRLHSKDGLLWSVGEHDILVFDGKTWEEIVCPDNT